MKLEKHLFEREPFDYEAYTRRVQIRPCFVCGIIARDPQFPGHIVYEDESTIVFLNSYPTLYGYTLVAPRQHREQVSGDFTLAEYVALQRVIYQVAEAVRRVVSTERVYLLSLGSQQGNRHVHWHVVPLPPGVPYAEQQLEALNLRHGWLKLPPDEMSALATRLHDQLVLLNGGG
jgi:diadenosine tetraphosphate (Ap4A) HIT family hydrolase